jgi:hypothetical protein
MYKDSDKSFSFDLRSPSIGQWLVVIDFSVASAQSTPPWSTIVQAVEIATPPT